MADGEFEELQHEMRRHIRPLRMAGHGHQAGPYVVAFGTNYTL